MRFASKTLAVALSAGLVLGLTASAHANGSTRHHHHYRHMRAHPIAPALPYAYGYAPDYAYYVPTRVFRCYPARQMVEDQAGLVVGYVPLGTCG
jgi:hypothetical protein